MVFGTWERTERPLLVQDFRSVALLIPTDEPILNQALHNGRVEIVGGSGRPAASPPGSRLFILFTGPLRQKVRLAHPDGDTLIYIQDGATFRRYPSDSQVLSRFVDLEPGNPGYVHYISDSALGRSGGSISIRLQ